MNIYPVIHCVDPREEYGIGHVLENVRVSFEAGAQGVFLIGHHMPALDLLKIYEHVRMKYVNYFIGINFLDVNTLEELAPVMRECVDVSGLWMDNVFVGARDAVGEIPIWGGVAFKYRNPNATDVQILAEIQHLRREGVDVAVTSGPKTGQSPTLEKIQRINTAIARVGWDVLLGIASGITVENVSRMKKVYAGLVASSICQTDERGHDWVIPEKLRALVTAVS